MICFQCKKGISPLCQHLTCGTCMQDFHFDCVSEVNQADFDFLKSSNSTWKCSYCKTKKLVKNDDTPIKPSKTVFQTLESGSGGESDTSQQSITGTKQKVICALCLKGFSHNSHRAICVNCKSNVHFKCTDMHKSDYLQEKDSWLCKSCKGQGGVGSGNSSVLTRPALSETDKLEVSKEVSLSELFVQMAALGTLVRNNHRDITDNMNKYSEWVVDQGKKIDEVSKQLIDLCNDVSSIRQENLNLKKQVVELSMKVNTMEQSMKDNIMEINGVPYKKEENVMDILRKMSEAIAFDFDNNMVDNCFRYKNVNNNGNIVVRFVRKLDMELFMQKRRVKRNLNSRDLGLMDGEASAIYCNYSLTQEKRKILNAAKAVKREMQFTFLWVKSGRIFMRKNPGDSVVIIDSLEDLNRLA